MSKESWLVRDVHTQLAPPPPFPACLQRQRCPNHRRQWRQIQVYKRDDLCTARPIKVRNVFSETMLLRKQRLTSFINAPTRCCMMVTTTSTLGTLRVAEVHITVLPDCDMCPPKGKAKGHPYEQYLGRCHPAVLLLPEGHQDGVADVHVRTKCRRNATGL